MRYFCVIFKVTFDIYLIVLKKCLIHNLNLIPLFREMISKFYQEVTEQHVFLVLLASSPEDILGKPNFAASKEFPEN